MYDYVGSFYIDVNGLKGPNQYGRGVYTFYLSNGDNLFPKYGKDYAIYRAQYFEDWSRYHWSFDPKLCGKVNKALSDSGVSTTSGISGIGCAARIMENNWGRDY